MGVDRLEDIFLRFFSLLVLDDGVLTLCDNGGDTEFEAVICETKGGFLATRLEVGLTVDGTVVVLAEVFTEVELHEHVVVGSDVLVLLLRLFLVDVVLVAIDEVDVVLATVVFAFEVLASNNNRFLVENNLVSEQDYVLKQKGPVRDHFEPLVVVPCLDDLFSLIHVVQDEVDYENDTDKTEPINHTSLSTTF